MTEATWVPWKLSSLACESRVKTLKPGQEHRAAEVGRLAVGTEVLVGDAGVEHGHRHRRVALLDIPRPLGAEHLEVPLERVDRSSLGVKCARTGASISANSTSGIERNRSDEPGSVKTRHGLDHIARAERAPRRPRPAGIAHAPLRRPSSTASLNWTITRGRVVGARPPPPAEG